MDLWILLTIIVLALGFDYINGFHDAANAIATVVSTKVLTPRVALMYGAVLNLAGALAGTAVAKTISAGIVKGDAVTPEVLIFALLGAILWNLITWIYGLPTSSSHALIGAMCGATAFASKAPFTEGIRNIQWDGVSHKVIIPMFVSPAIGIVAGYLVMLAIYWICKNMRLGLVNRIFSKLQILSAGVMAFSHGQNDAQKSMGIITLALATYGHTSKMDVPLWVMLACAAAMGLGTMSGGWKIIRTMGTKMIKLQPIQGFAAETTAGTIIMVASRMGLPLSTTHIISTAIMGVGATRRLSAVKWGVVGNIVWAWVLTLPLTFFLSGGLFWLYHRIIHPF